MSLRVEAAIEEAIALGKLNAAEDMVEAVAASEAANTVEPVTRAKAKELAAQEEQQVKNNKL